MDLRSERSRRLVAALFMITGALHFITPQTYESIMPSILPAHRELVLLSGVGEVLGGLGLLHPTTRRLAGLGLIGLLLAVWPANFQMIFNARAAGASALTQSLLILRLPLQIALMAWVWQASQPRRTR